MFTLGLWGGVQAGGTGGLVKQYKHKNYTARAYTGTHCEYVKLNSVTANQGCEDGTKFVLKAPKGTRKQFLILTNQPILAFVENGVKFTECTAYTEVTLSVDCKEVEGLINVDLAGSNSETTTATEETDEVITRVQGYID